MVTRYFSHDENARNDPKVTKIRMRFGMEGYGCYFALLEILSTESGHRLAYSQEQFEAIAYDFHCTLDVKEFIDKCIDVGLFQTDGEMFWSEAFNRRLEVAAEKAKKRAAKSKIAANARWGKTQKDESQKQAESAEKYGEDILSIDTLNPEWIRFVKEYENNLGLIPHGGTKSGQLIMDYFDDLGADVMCKAVEQTSLAQPENPATYMLAILKNWAEKGVKTAQQADAATIDHKRRSAARAKRQADNDTPKSTGIRGKFY